MNLLTSKFLRFFLSTLRVVFLGALLIIILQPLNASSEGKNPLKILLDKVSSPELLEKYMASQFTYVEDRFLIDDDEYWQGPEEMLTRKKGDCEDYAVFAKAMLEEMGYSACLISLYWEDDAHTVTVFQRDGYWWFFNVNRLQKSFATSLLELANEIKPGATSIGIMRKEGSIGIISRKFLRSQANIFLSYFFLNSQGILTTNF